MDKLLARLKLRLSISDTSEDALLTDHLQSAIDVVNELRNYTSTNDDIVESQYESIVVDLAVSTYNKMGAEGEIGHSENGVNRTYESSEYPSSLLARILIKPRQRIEYYEDAETE